MLDILPSPAEGRYAFHVHDEVKIGGIAYRPYDRSESHYHFAPTSGGVAVSYSNAELSRLVALGSVDRTPNAFQPEHLRRRAQLSTELLSGLTGERRQGAKRPESVAPAFTELEGEGKVKRTDCAINAALPAIKQMAGKFLSIPSDGDDHRRRGNVTITPAKVSARSLRRWLRDYELFGLGGLYDRVEARGARSCRLSLEEQGLMWTEVRRCMSSQRPLQATIYENVRGSFRRENEVMAAQGKPALATPSRETVRQAIKSLDPFQVDVARLGLDRARKKHAPVGNGLDLTRPLQRVEIDEWKVDLASLAAEAGILHHLSQEDRERLGLDRARTRWWLTVAMCATTRCILAMKLSRSPSSQSAIQTIDMAMRDKGQWSDAVGALSPWSMAGRPEEIVADCGSAFISFDTRAAAKDIDCEFTHAPAGLPEMRARIERLFGTMGTSLLPRLTGRTFSDMIEKGDQDPNATAALNVEDLCEALVRWVVDIYHRRPHDGLGGETPARRRRRLVEEHGVRPAPDLRRRRLAFGTRMERPVAKTGITVFGVRYHSEGLARRAMHSRARKLRIRWYSENIGAIAVEIDGKWIEVPAVHERFEGVQAIHWLAAAHSLRSTRRREAELDEDVVFKAIDAIEQLNGDAMKRMGLLVQDWTEEQLQRLEETYFIGFDYGGGSGREAPKRLAMERDDYGHELATAADLGMDPSMLPEPTMASPDVSAPDASNRSHLEPQAKPARSPRRGAKWTMEKKS